MSTPGTQPEPSYKWYRELTRYHWFVLSVASMGWMFDTMAQQLFNLARKPAIRDLLGPGASAGQVDIRMLFVRIAVLRTVLSGEARVELGQISRHLTPPASGIASMVAASITP